MNKTQDPKLQIATDLERKRERERERERELGFPPVKRERAGFSV